MLAEQALYMARNREFKVKALLARLTTQFEWILIDCPPALGNLTDNALNAARQVIIPVQAEATSVRALELLFDQIESIEKGLNIHVEVLAIVPNLVQNSSMTGRILTELRCEIPAVVTPFELPRRVLLQSAWSNGCSIFAYPPGSRAEERTKAEITGQYRELAGFVTARVEERSHG
jgi:chromosome partitioning protein